MTRKATVLIVGAGVGGVACARRLAKHSSRLNVAVIDPAPTHVFAPSLPWLLDRSRTPEQITRPNHHIERYGATFHQESVERIDTDAATVSTNLGNHHYDYLVLAPGAELALDAIDGLDAAESFYALPAAQRLADRLTSFDGGRVLLTIPAMPYKCPAAPYESAFLIEAYLRRRKIDATIEIRTVEPQPMPVAGPKLGGRVVELLERRGINYVTGQNLQRVNAEARTVTFETGDVPYDLLVTIPPHRAPAFVRESPLAGPAGWIPVDKATLAASDNVWAIGDVTSITLANGKPLPKAGVFAHAQAHVVADSIARLAQGHQPVAVFDGHGACFLEIGQGKAGFARGNFYATPNPAVRMLPPSRLGHLGKAIFERRWLKQLDTAP